MKQLTKAEANDFIATQQTFPSGKAKSPLRVAIDAIEPEGNLLLDRGVDYDDYRKVYYMLREVTKTTGRKFLYKPTAKKDKMLIVRLS